jgi:hypothetical protein
LKEKGTQNRNAGFRGKKSFKRFHIDRYYHKKIWKLEKISGLNHHLTKRVGNKKAPRNVGLLKL